jgi:hypothetical protein
MNRGRLWCPTDEWMREVVWLEEPNMAQCTFQSTQGETIVLNSIKRIVAYPKGDCTITLKDGRTFELEVTELT